MAFVACGGSPQTTQNTIDGSLPRESPESQNVNPAGIEAFYQAVDADSMMKIHSIMVLRNGKVVAQRWWDGHTPEESHVLHSCSKSFAATAVGFAAAESLLTLDDPVISFFPEDVPEQLDPRLARMKVRDLLTMSMGIDDQYNPVPQEGWSWMRTGFSIPMKWEPGTTFRYNSTATFLLSFIVQKVSGEKLVDYLKPRLWDPLEIAYPKWEDGLEGITAGGWGLYLKTEDMAKFGQLFLQNGIWNGKQVLPEGWVEEASTYKIASFPSWDYTLVDPTSDWTQGYCYQMWRCRHNAYRADGAGGQFIVIMPDQNAVVAITADLLPMQVELNLVWDHILPAFE